MARVAWLGGNALAVAVAVCSLMVSMLPSASAGRVAVKVVASIPFKGGTDLAFSGDYAFIGSLDGGRMRDGGDGGLYVVKIDGDEPRLVGKLGCPGYQNDVGVWRNTVVMGMHQHQPRAGCGSTAFGGLRLVDVSDATNPRQTAFLRIPPNGTHTLTVVGDTGFVYSNPGGQVPAWALESGRPPAPSPIAIVDIRDQKAPRIVGAFAPPDSYGCHDIAVNADATRAYCAASNMTQIWDINDPVHPRVIATILDPAVQFHHSAVPSPDGKMLVVTDEAASGHVCDGVVNKAVTGALWFFDISDETLPRLTGWVAPGPVPHLSANGWCTAHNFAFFPGEPWLSVATFTGGTSIVDFSDATNPVVIASVTPPDTYAWSSYPYRGRVYVADERRGLDVVSVGED